ncbi:hypothetical protein TrST_g13985 [Triparma strigata]|uniref:RED-like N-terminal domain-containing protein n=1 Tax=Triparma strigata TaxID=1606541 RepID=A0A9W7BH36_9STRA|nr:hypothetical protein TrST_g13985 [Triparma strigata]
MNNSDFLAHASKKFDVKSSIETFDKEKSKLKSHNSEDLPKKKKQIYRRGKLITSNDVDTSSSTVYRNRALERKKSGLDSDFASTSSLLSNFTGSSEMSQYLGGTEEFTHLVKGLDRRLLDRQREEIREDRVEGGEEKTSITELVRKHVNSDVTSISSVMNHLKLKLFRQKSTNNSTRSESYVFNFSEDNIRKIKRSGVPPVIRRSVGSDVLKIIEAGRLKGVAIEKTRKEDKLRLKRIEKLKEEAEDDDIFDDEGEYVPGEISEGRGDEEGKVVKIFDDEKEEEAIEVGGKLVLPTFHSGVDVSEDNHKDILGGKKSKKRERENDGTFGGNDYGEDVDVDFGNDEGADMWNEYVDEGEGEGGEKKKGKKKRKKKKE